MLIFSPILLSLDCHTVWYCRYESYYHSSLAYHFFMNGHISKMKFKICFSVILLKFCWITESIVSPTENLNSVNDSLRLDVFDPSECGLSAPLTKIFGGSDTEIGAFPWLAFIQYRRSDDRLIAACDGSLINQRYVLTAAHCTTNDILSIIGKL